MSLIDTYSQQYSCLTSEIIACTAQIHNISGSEKGRRVKHVEQLIGETKELLEQMQMEVYSMPDNGGGKHHVIVKSFQTQLASLDSELVTFATITVKKSQYSLPDEMRMRDDLFMNDQSDNQRESLLQNSNRLGRLGKNIDDSYRTCLETEEIGNTVLRDLGEQKETIQRSRNRLRETNEVLGRSSRILSNMMKRVIQNKLLLVAVIVIMVVVIGFLIYMFLFK